MSAAGLGIAPQIANAATVIGPGLDSAQPASLYGCGAKPCAFFNSWSTRYGAAADDPRNLPTLLDGVVVRVRAELSARDVPGTVAFGTIHRGEPNSTYYDVRDRSEPVGVTGEVTIDAPVRMAIRRGDTLAVFLTGGARILANGDPRGDHDLSVGDTDGTSRFEVRPFGTPDAVVPLHYEAFVEPDSDADGFGDESQDRCAGSTGSHDGCAEPAPAAPAPPSAVARPKPLLAGVAWTGRRLRYTIARRAAVTVTVQRRTAGVWRRILRRKAPGAPGRHSLRLRPTARHGRYRAVITATVAGRQTTRIVSHRR
jgi:hypothetical protein